MNTVGGSSTGAIGTGMSTNLGIYSFNDSSVVYKIDDESLINHPPKYEDIMKQIKRESKKMASAGGTNSASGNITGTSSSVLIPMTSSNASADAIVPLRELSSIQDEQAGQQEATSSTLLSPPSYVSAILGKKSSQTNGQIVI